MSNRGKTHRQAVKWIMWYFNRASSLRLGYGVYGTAWRVVTRTRSSLTCWVRSPWIANYQEIIPNKWLIRFTNDPLQFFIFRFRSNNTSYKKLICCFIFKCLLAGHEIVRICDSGQSQSRSKVIYWKLSHTVNATRPAMNKMV